MGGMGLKLILVLVRRLSGPLLLGLIAALGGPDGAHLQLPALPHRTLHPTHPLYIPLMIK